MSAKRTGVDYMEKFCALSETNQKCIAAMQQALIYAQMLEEHEKKLPGSKK